MSASFEPLLDSAAAACLLDIHPVTLLRWAKSNRVPHHRLGRKVKFRASELNAWLGSNNSGYTQPAAHALN
jgi:excisionase family DNA binding protein